MRYAHSTMLPRSITGNGIVWAALAVALAVLAGCAIHGTVKQAPGVRKPSANQNASSARLGDGREGFIITEVPRMSGASRRDFESAVAMLNDQDYGNAVELLEKVVEQEPGVTAPYINLAIAYQQIGKPEKAEAQLKTALNLVPGHPAACNEYGLLCRKAGRFDEARTIYAQALTGFPDYYPVHRNLGILCDLYLHDLECALKHYEIYNQARPEDVQVKMWIADLRARLGRQ